MTIPDQSNKQAKEKVQQALENLVDATTRHGGESREADQAKEKRALAEKEIVDSRKHSDK